VVVAARGLAAELGGARDAGAHPFVAFTEGSATRALLLRHLPEAEIAMELGSIAAVKANVRAGVGLALVSRVAVETELGQGRLVEVKTRFTPLRRRLALIHRGVDRLPPAAAALRAVLLAEPGEPPRPQRRALPPPLPSKRRRNGTT
jgi:DNA-binding transcriptional LysR family regulator